MNALERRSLLRGAACGFLAGAVFAQAELVAVTTTGESPLLPFRLFASLWLGKVGLTIVDASKAVVVGAVVHSILSAAFGAIYAFAWLRARPIWGSSWERSAVFGTSFGFLLWAVNFQVVAKALFPWFLQASQPRQLVLHAFFFGLPLGLAFAAVERPAPPVGGPPRPSR